MCTAGCIIFGATQLSLEQVQGKRILEVGSYDVNGSLRPIIERWSPTAYVGVDAQSGPGVDVVCFAERLTDAFGVESFDVVVSTGTIEHIRDWRGVIKSIKAVCKRNGTILITTCSRDFPYHGYPYDFWRYEPSDLEHLFSDCLVEALETDRSAPLVFLKAKKPDTFVERDVSSHALYSVIVRRRVRELDEREFEAFQKRYRRRIRLRSIERWVKLLWRRDG